jgi:hypothetical protein
MKLSPLFFATAIAVALPALAVAQHSHGGGGWSDPSPTRQKHEDPSPPSAPRGLRPPGSGRQIEVLVVSHGFSPTEIPADQGEEIVLLVRRSAESRCTSGLTIPERHLDVQLPLDETVPVTLKLDRAETIELQCAKEDFRASIVVAPR